MPTINLPPPPGPPVIPLAARHEAVAAAASSASPVAPLHLPFIVTADDRERTGGWKFVGLAGDSGDGYRPLAVQLEFQRIETADYTIRRSASDEAAGNSGDLSGLLIERKSHEDVIGSIGGGHVRFRAEHERLAEAIRWGGYGCVIVESSFERVCQELDDGTAGRRYGSTVLRGIVASWPMQFSVPWFFAGTRQNAEDLALRIMRKWYESRTVFAPKTRRRRTKKAPTETQQEQVT